MSQSERVCNTTQHKKKKKKGNSFFVYILYNIAYGTTKVN